MSETPYINTRIGPNGEQGLFSDEDVAALKWHIDRCERKLVGKCLIPFSRYYAERELYRLEGWLRVSEPPRMYVGMFSVPQEITINHE